MINRTFLHLGALISGIALASSCAVPGGEKKITPKVITAPVRFDSEDPAIWLNRENPAGSLILATDKDAEGSVYVFDLKGKTIEEKTVRGIKRPNNIDVGYGFSLNGQPVDIAVVTERLENRIRVFRLPDMTALDNGGIPVFAGEEQNAPMGIAVYQRPADGIMYVIVSRKEGPDGTYLWQYRLDDSGKGFITAEKVRAFGRWSGQKEIEAVAVDNELGYVYYSDEGVGVRKYHADPGAPDRDRELALFATRGFAEDHEGIAICKTGSEDGYIIVSDQAAGKLRLYPRNRPDHRHELVKTVMTSALETDGIEAATGLVLPEYPSGILVAMSDDRTYHYYSLQDILPFSEPQPAQKP